MVKLLEMRLEREDPFAEQEGSTPWTPFARLIDEFDRRTSMLRAQYREGALTDDMLQRRLDEVAEFVRTEGERINAWVARTIAFSDLYTPNPRPFGERLGSYCDEFGDPLLMLDRMSPDRDAGSPGR